MSPVMLASGGHGPPWTLFTPLWEAIRGTSWGRAWGFDAMARRVAGRARAVTDGFTYDADRDAWCCPHNEWLWPTSVDSDSRLKRYRAEPSACNRCPAPLRCTGSLHGREISRAVDPWPHPGTGRFHRGIACFVAGLGVTVPLVALSGRNSGVDTAVLIGAAVLVGLGALPLARGLWRPPGTG